MPKYLPNHSAAALAAVTPMLALTLAGCGSGDDEPSTRTAVGNLITYGSFGTSADIDCGRGKSLNVGGSNNTLKVFGDCASVSVTGADNTITLERVDGELTVVGLNNSVTYKAGQPAVDDSGVGNRVNRG
jgi:hypothetical protein